MNKKLFVLLLLSSTCFALKPYENKAAVLSAKEARDVIMKTEYAKHPEEIDKWVKIINNTILEESRKPNACASVDVIKASDEVGWYLYNAYVDKGYNASKTPQFKNNVIAPGNRIHEWIGLCW